MKAPRGSVVTCSIVHPEDARVNSHILCFFFFQAEDGIRDYKVTGVQTCALPIFYGALVEPIFQCLNDTSGDLIGEVAAEGTFTCTIPRLPLSPGHYTISAFCELEDRKSVV